MSEWDERGPEEEGEGSYGEGKRDSSGTGYYNSYEYAYKTVMRNGRPKTLGWSVASLVTGIVSVVCCCLGWVGFIGIAAIVFAVIARRQLGYFDGMAIAGLILGIFGVVFGFAMLMLLYSDNAEFWQQLEDIYNQSGDYIPDTDLGGETSPGNGGGVNNGF